MLLAWFFIFVSQPHRHWPGPEAQGTGCRCCRPGAANQGAAGTLPRPQHPAAQGEPCGVPPPAARRPLPPCARAPRPGCRTPSRNRGMCWSRATRMCRLWAPLAWARRRQAPASCPCRPAAPPPRATPTALWAARRCSWTSRGWPTSATYTWTLWVGAPLCHQQTAVSHTGEKQAGRCFMAGGGAPPTTAGYTSGLQGQGGVAWRSVSL